MDKETQGLAESKAFTVLDKLSEGEKAVGSRWVLLYKSDKEGLTTKTKARLVAKGFMQREGVNYLQTSSSTPAAASVKAVIYVANELKYKVYHLEIIQEFKKADLDCVGYMKLPGGCSELPGKFVRLQKALYGLRHSGAAVERPAGGKVGHCAWYGAVQD